MHIKGTDKETYEFLSDLGFKPRRDSSEYQYLHYDLSDSRVSIRLNDFKKITTLKDLFEILYKEGHRNGREVGKDEALYSITEKLKEFIYS